MRLGNPLTTTYTYDALTLRLKRLQTGALLDLNYAYDPVGNITRITDTLNSGQVITFSYDALDRLVGANTTLAGTGQYTHTYAYNPIGNLTSMAGVTQWYSDTAHVHAATHLTGTQKFWYDQNGNMTKRIEGGATYSQTWDAENRLTVVTNTVSGMTTTFFYDGDGARIKKVDRSSTTVYVGAIEVLITGTLRITRTYYTAGTQLVAMRVVTSTGGNVPRVAYRLFPARYSLSRAELGVQFN